VKIGFIFECGPDGADVQVCQILVSKIRPEIECITRTLDNKPNLVNDCGKVADMLLEECRHVIIIWDMYPPWREFAPCLHEDRVNIFNSLDEEGIDRTKVSLVCIREELEAWLIADNRALTDVIARYKHPHRVRRITNYSSPDSVSKPKTKLIQMFQHELGRNRRYVDYRDAKKIVSAIPDLKRIRRSVSFLRFHDIIQQL